MNTSSPNDNPRRAAAPSASATREHRSAVSAADVYAERVRLLYRSPFPAAANLAVAILLAVVAWGHVESVGLVMWLLAMAVTTALRIMLWKVFSLRPTTLENASLWERRMLFSAIAGAAVWAVTGMPIAMGNLPTYAEGIVPIAVGGMLAGAIFSLTASPVTFRCYSIITVSGPILGFAAVGDPMHLAVAGMGVV